MTSTTAVTVAPSIAEALKTASARTGVGFDYLLKTAIRESGLEPAAKAASSTAVGLFQFVEQTWFAMLKETGSRHGLENYSDNITKIGDRYEIADPQSRQEILALRSDPKIAAVMAGEFTHRNATELARGLGRPPTAGELYIGHFLGAKGAGELIHSAATEPSAAAADLFPTAAGSNQPIFYDPSGAKRTVREVYASLVRHHDRAPSPSKSIEPRETITPFAGVVAFFERLFPPPAIEPAQQMPVRSPAPTPPQPTPPQPVIAEQMPGGAPGGPTALVARKAASAYRHQAASLPAQQAVEVESGAPATRLRSTITPGSWSQSLFENSPRRDGPLVLLPPQPVVSSAR